MIYKGDVSHLGRLVSIATHRQFEHQRERYLNSEVFKEFPFILHTAYGDRNPLTMLTVKNYWIDKDKIVWLYADKEWIPASYFYKPLIDGRVGRIPEHQELKVIRKLHKQLIKNFTTRRKYVELYIGETHQKFTSVSDIQKVPRIAGRDPKADMILVSPTINFWISYKDSHRFQTWGGISEFKNQPIVKEFRAKLLKWITLKRGVPKGIGHGMMLDTNDYMQEALIGKVMFGSDFNSLIYGPNNVNVIMIGNPRITKHINHFHLLADHMIWNDSSFNIKEHPMQLVLHHMHDRHDLGFKESHAMLSSLDRRCIMI